MSKLLYKGPFYLNNFFRKQISSEIYNNNSLILPNFIGLTIYIYNGKIFIPCFITLNKIGYKFSKFLRLFKLNKNLKFKDFVLK